jgi:hypothetical protein
MTAMMATIHVATAGLSEVGLIEPGIDAGFEDADFTTFLGTACELASSSTEC